jgi:hypothetical protein
MKENYQICSKWNAKEISSYKTEMYEREIELQGYLGKYNKLFFPLKCLNTSILMIIVMLSDGIYMGM